MIVLILLLTSCRTTKQQTVTVYPELTFPKFPKPKKTTPLDKDLNKVTNTETEIKYVLIDFEYYQQLAEYKLDMKELEAEYNGFVESLK